MHNVAPPISDEPKPYRLQEYNMLPVRAASTALGTADTAQRIRLTPHLCKVERAGASPLSVQAHAKRCTDFAER